MLDRGNNLTANIPYLSVFIKPESGLLLLTIDILSSQLTTLSLTLLLLILLSSLKYWSSFLRFFTSSSFRSSILCKTKQY